MSPGTVLKAACAFANSRDGGDLIIGAEKPTAKPWVLTGIELGKAEITQWASSIISGGLRPRPTFDIQSLRLPGTRQGAVVHIEPTPTPPCITKDGAVYVRVAGQSIPVTDPVELARLYEAGERARARTEEAAKRAYQTGWEETPLRREMGRPYAMVAAAAVGNPSDISRALFQPTFADRVSDLLEQHLPTTGHIHPPMASLRNDWMAQDRIVVVRHEPVGHREMAWLMAFWSGAVVAGRGSDGPPGDQEISAQFIPRLVTVVSGTLEALGAKGATWMRAGIVSVKPARVLDRWLDPPGTTIDTSVLEGMAREFTRARGDTAWEP